jgi:hypothetical protein
LLSKNQTVQRNQNYNHNITMKSVCIVLLIALSVSSLVSAFVPSSPHNRHNNNRMNTLSMMVSMVDLPPVVVAEVVALPASQLFFTTAGSSTVVESGIRSYLSSTNAADTVQSSTLTVSLKERPPPPTKEEIEAKQRNFNVLFWGGGFVAPFVATVFYFGPKFWEK